MRCHWVQKRDSQNPEKNGAGLELTGLNMTGRINGLYASEQTTLLTRAWVRAVAL